MKFNYMKSAAMALAFACCVSSCSCLLYTSDAADEL